MVRVRRVAASVASGSVGEGGGKEEEAREGSGSLLFAAAALVKGVVEVLRCGDRRSRRCWTKAWPGGLTGGEEGAGSVRFLSNNGLATGRSTWCCCEASMAAAVEMPRCDEWKGRR